jgi:hypothetical protein
MTTYRPVIAVDKQHRPAAGTEKVDPSTLQLSGRSGNTLQVLDDGLFAGHSSAGTTFYVSSSGSDAPASGTKTAPYKTLDYCLAQIKANDPLADSQLVSTYLRIALKAGEVFDMETTVNTVGSVVLTFYGDPTYGDFDSPFVGGTTDPAVMSDLSRPTIRPKVISGMTIMHGFRLLLNGQIELRGVRVDLPDTVPGAQAASWSAATCSTITQGIQATIIPTSRTEKQAWPFQTCCPDWMRSSRAKKHRRKL